MRAWSAVALLFAWSSLAAAQTPQCGIDDKLVTISFGHAVTDEDASAFLVRHQLAPSSGFLWVDGAPLAVSIAPAAPGDAATSLRAATESSRLANKTALVAQAAAFIAQHTRGELVRDFALAEQGRELLRQAAREDKLVSRARARTPLLWAFSVCASPEALAGVSAEEGVEVTEGATAARPEVLSSRFPAPRVDLLSGAETYAALVKLAQS